MAVPPGKAPENVNVVRVGKKIVAIFGQGSNFATRFLIIIKPITINTIFYDQQKLDRGCKARTC